MGPKHVTDAKLAVGDLYVQASCFSLGGLGYVRLVLCFVRGGFEMGQRSDEEAVAVE